jgi:hypothetical protein
MVLAQYIYMEQDHGIATLHLLVNMLHPLDSRSNPNIINPMQSLQLPDTKDLHVYLGKLENYNLQLSWV